jgi:pilus assembly protein CpaC
MSARGRLSQVFLAAAIVLTGATLAAPSYAQKAGKGDEHTEDLNLAVGEQKTISAAGIKNFGDNPPGIVSTNTTPDQKSIVISAKKPGNATVLLIKNDDTQITYNITVSQRSLAAVEKELTQLLEGMPGITIRKVGGKLYIEGGVNSDADFKRIGQIAGAYAGQVENLVTVGSGGTDRKLLVRLDLFFVSYERTSSYAVGLAWPGAIGGDAVLQNRVDYDLIAKTTTTAQASVVNQPLPRLDIGSKHGWLKILKQSTVITANGSEATFNSGGEQNFSSANSLQATLFKIQFGTNVNVLPRYDTKTKEIEVKVESEISDLTAPVSGTSIPGRTTTKLSTFVNLKLGQALVLSGIRTRTERHDISGLPGLSTIPILGILFGSHNDASVDAEGAVFIIPSIIETVPKSAIEVIKNALTAYEDYSGDIEHVDSWNKTPPSAK